MSNDPFRRVYLITFLLVSVMLPVAVAGQEVTNRVVFKKGQSSATFKGKLPRGHSDYDSYLLKARKGQTIAVKLTCRDQRAAFAIYELNELGPDEDTIFAPNKEVRQFTGKLPVTSEYSVQVYGVIFGDEGNSSQAPYTLEIAVTNAAAAPPAAASRRALPSDLERYVDEYPEELRKLPAITARLRTLLGKQYSDFVASIQVQGPTTKVGDFLLAHGCLPHACTISEAAFAIDLKNKRIHAAIFDKDSPAKFFNEDKAPTPQVLLDWVRELEKQ